MLNNGIYETTYSILYGQIDHSYRVTQTAYLTLVEETVAQCTFSKQVAAIDLSKLGKTWVISDIQMEFTDTPAMWKDSVTTKLWIAELTPLRCFYDYEIYKKSQTDNEPVLVCKGFICYSIIDIETGKPERVDEIMSKFTVVDKKVFGNHPKVLIAPGSTPDGVDGHRVKAADIDFNMHVSNLKYLESAINTESYEFYLEHVQSYIKLKFLKQTFSGDTISSEWYDKGDGKRVYMIRNSAGEEVARAEILWIKKKADKYAVLDGFDRN